MNLAELPFLRTEKSGDTVLEVHVMPNASKTQVQGLHDGALHVRLKAPPVEGKANELLLSWLSKELAIPRQSITLLRGEKSRRKQYRIAQAEALKARWADLWNAPSQAQ